MSNSEQSGKRKRDRTVYFHLWDFNGKAYKGSHLQKVSLCPGDDPLDCQAEVYQANLKKLASFDAVDLTVYQDAKHFDAKDPMEVTDPVPDDCGQKETPLIVVVPERDFNFLLVDSSGNPYRNCSVSSVTLPSTSSSETLRDAALAKHSAVFSGVDPSQLQVYASKKHFDARHDLDKDHSPIAATLGLTDDNPLIVVVPERDFYFSLLDSSGSSYNNTLVSSVTLPLTSSSEKLRDAALSKHSAILQGFSSSQLRVYASKKLFDDLNENSLLDKDHSPIEAGLGVKYENPLIVVVPDVEIVNTTSLPLSLGTVLDACQDFVDFATKLEGGPESCTVLKIPGAKDIFGALLDASCNLFVRSSYGDLFDAIMKRRDEIKTIARSPHFLVIGSPGIGKSVFGIYCLLRLIQGKKNVAYRGLESEFFIYFTAGVEGTYKFTTSMIEGATYFKLLDDKEQIGDFEPFPFSEASFLFSSPAADNFNDFKKYNCSTFCLDPWSFKEMMALSMHAEMSDQWVEKYSTVGGIPRLVFSTHTANELAKAVKSSMPTRIEELKDLIYITRNYRAATIKGSLESPHLLLHFWQGLAIGRHFMQFATKEIEEMAVELLSMQDMDKIKKLMRPYD